MSTDLTKDANIHISNELLYLIAVLAILTVCSHTDKSAIIAYLMQSRQTNI